MGIYTALLPTHGLVHPGPWPGHPRSPEACAGSSRTALQKPSIPPSTETKSSAGLPGNNTCGHSLDGMEHQSAAAAFRLWLPARNLPKVACASLTQRSPFSVYWYVKRAQLLQLPLKRALSHKTPNPGLHSVNPGHSH